MARAPRTIKVPGETAAVPEHAPEQSQRRPLASELPDATDIDPKTLTRAVLTRQGWVCPE